MSEDGATTNMTPKPFFSFNITHYNITHYYITISCTLGYMCKDLSLTYSCNICYGVFGKDLSMKFFFTMGEKKRAVLSNFQITYNVFISIEGN